MSFPGHGRTVQPTVRAVLVNGKIVRPKRGMDWLYFGVTKFVPVRVPVAGGRAIE
jgi:hypothetical protein